MCTVRYIGRFLPDAPLDVPWVVAGQLGIADVSCVKRYTERKPTAYEHAWAIRDAYRLGRLKLSQIPPNRMAALARYALGSKAPLLERAPEPKRRAKRKTVVHRLAGRQWGACRRPPPQEQGLVDQMM